MTGANGRDDRVPDFSRLAATVQSQDRPPAAERQRGPGRPSKATTRATLERRLTEQFGAIGITVCVFDPYCGQSVIMGAERLAKALARLADENPAMRRALNMSLQGSAWLELTVALAYIAIPVASHHGLLPADVLRNIPIQMGPQPNIPDYPPADLGDTSDNAGA